VYILLFCFTFYSSGNGWLYYLYFGGKRHELLTQIKKINADGIAFSQSMGPLPLEITLTGLRSAKPGSLRPPC
jgi:hypothetical protein